MNLLKPVNGRRGKFPRQVVPELRPAVSVGMHFAGRSGDWPACDIAGKSIGTMGHCKGQLSGKGSARSVEG